MPESSSASSRFGGLLFVATAKSKERLGEDALARLGVDDGASIDILDSGTPYDLRRQIWDLTAARPQENPVTGVVVMGNYQDFPSRPMLCLDPTFQQTIEKKFGGTDEDAWMVWSDDLYGALGPSLLPTVPVSRVPLLPDVDATPGMATPGTRAGAVQAEEFDFGQDIFDLLANRNGNGSLLPAPPTDDSQAYRMQMAGLFSDAERVYILLHGDEQPGIRLMSGGRSTDVIKEDLFQPAWRTQALVFSGACWGGLIATWARGVLEKKDAVTPRNLENAFALAMLACGAKSVVGFSTHHYLSANRKDPSLGGELHRYFWEGIECCGLAPAPALFRAKTMYIQSGAARSPGDGQKAIRMKTFWSATCLGLGW